ncbi:hypothetical protein D3C76_1542530 [compost metagenome]
MLDGEVQFAVLDHPRNLLNGLLVVRQAFAAQLLRHVQRVLAELRERRQPTEPCRQRVNIGRMQFAVTAAPRRVLLLV